MKLWLDDVRPPPPGWTPVRTIDEAKVLLQACNVDELSLDHDLGNYADLYESCPSCLPGSKECSHPLPTGYDLCKWMAEHGVWPKTKPVIHSSNVRGREDMQSCIDRYFPGT